MGVDPTVIRCLERGQRGTHWRTVKCILAALEATVGNFVDEIDAAERELRP